MFFSSVVRKIDLPEFGARLRVSENFHRVEVFRLTEDAEEESLGFVRRRFWKQESRFPLDEERILVVYRADWFLGEGTEVWNRLTVRLDDDSSEVHVVQVLDPRWLPGLVVFLLALSSLLSLQTFGGIYSNPVLGGLALGLLFVPMLWGIPGLRRGVWEAGILMLCGMSTFVFAALVPDGMTGPPGPESGMGFLPILIFGSYILIAVARTMIGLPAAISRFRRERFPNEGEPPLLYGLFGARLGLTDRWRLTLSDLELTFHWTPGFGRLWITSEGDTIPVYGLDRKQPAPVGLTGDKQLTVGPLLGLPLPYGFQVDLGDQGTYRIVDGAAGRLSRAFGLMLGAAALGGFAWGFAGIVDAPIRVWFWDLPAAWMLGLTAVAAIVVGFSSLFVTLGIRPGSFEALGLWTTLAAGGMSLLVWVLSGSGSLFYGPNEPGSIRIVDQAFGVFWGLIGLLATVLWLNFLAHARIWREVAHSASLEPTWTRMDEQPVELDGRED